MMMRTSHSSVIGDLMGLLDEEKTIHDLPNEVLMMIMEALDIPSLVNAAAVSRTWREIASDGHLWKKLCSRKWKSDSLPFSPEDRRIWKKIHFFETLAKKSESILGYPVTASSTDYPDQGIDNTLIDNEITYWSSKGNADRESSEYLSYQLAHPVCIVKRIHLKVYQASWQYGEPIYAPKTLTVYFGMGTSFTHVVPLGEVQRTAESQFFDLSRPVVANQIMIKLEGRTAKQPSDNLWYTVVQFFDVIGYILPSLKQEKDLCAAIVKPLAGDLTKEVLKKGYPLSNYSPTVEFFSNCPRIKKTFTPIY